MFDEVIIDSINLGELPYLIKMFGVEGLKYLLDSKILKIKQDNISIITDIAVNGKRQLPLFQFDEGIARSQQTEDSVNRMLSPLRSVPGLKGARREELESTVLSSLLRFGDEYGDGLLKQIRADITSKPVFIKSLLEAQIGNPEIGKIIFQVHDLGGMQRFESNLQPTLNITPEQEHQIWSKVITGATNLNQRLAEMVEFNAISHFETHEAPFLFGKLHSLTRPLAPNADESAFLRVISFTDLPSFIENKRIDVEHLLRVRCTDECRLFRDWLATTDSIEDKKLDQILNGLKAKAASFIASGPGKTVRFGVNTGLGLIPGYGTFVAIAEGIVDTFLIDKLLPSSGVLTFLNNEIPSIFKNAS